MKLTRDKILLLGLCPMCKVRLEEALTEWETQRNKKISEGVLGALAQGKKGGRPMGSKDKKKRKRSGYYRRYEANKGKLQTSTYGDVDLVTGSNHNKG